MHTFTKLEFNFTIVIVVLGWLTISGGFKDFGRRLVDLSCKFSSPPLRTPPYAAYVSLEHSSCSTWGNKAVIIIIPALFWSFMVFMSFFILTAVRLPGLPLEGPSSIGFMIFRIFCTFYFELTISNRCQGLLFSNQPRYLHLICRPLQHYGVPQHVWAHESQRGKYPPGFASGDLRECSQTCHTGKQMTESQSCCKASHLVVLGSF